MYIYVALLLLTFKCAPSDRQMYPGGTCTILQVGNPCSSAVVGKLQPVGQIRPAKPFHPARQHRSVSYATGFHFGEQVDYAICQSMTNSIYVDVVTQQSLYVTNQHWLYVRCSTVLVTACLVVGTFWSTYRQNHSTQHLASNKIIEKLDFLVTCHLSLVKSMEPSEQRRKVDKE